MNAGGSRKGEQQATETNARLADLFEHADPVVAGFMARHNALLERVTVLERALEELADLHHRTLSGSRRHDPENRDWRDCPCLSCRGAREALDA